MYRLGSLAELHVLLKLAAEVPGQQRRTYHHAPYNHFNLPNRLLFILAALENVLSCFIIERSYSHRLATDTYDELAYFTVEFYIREIVGTFSTAFHDDCYQIRFWRHGMNRGTFFKIRGR